MATILDLGKLRFHFAGVYDATTEYEMNDIVKYGGNVYVYSNVTRTTGNIPTDTAYWTLMVEGFKFRQVYDWTFKLLFIISILTFSIASLMNSF